MNSLEAWELASYIVTVIGLPLAIIVFLYEQRRERRNEEEELHQRLSDEYTGFLKLCLENADLHLLKASGVPESGNAEQEERKLALFGILISLLERAYILIFEEEMDRQARRIWQSWEDFMREWCRREDFRAALPPLLEGEDEDFVRHITRLAQVEQQRSQSGNAGAQIDRLR
jgi:hypothetical protein